MIFLETVLISVVTTILLFFTLHFIINPKIRFSEINRERLKDLYGPLYAKIINQRKYLKAEMQYREYEEEIEGKVYKDGEPDPIIEGFDEIIPEVEELIAKNIHLLIRQDAVKWHKYIRSKNDFNEMSDSREAHERQVLDQMVDYHRKFISFIDEAQHTYYKLFHEYYGISYEKIMKEKFLKEKEQINNNFIDDERKLIELEKLYQREEQIYKRYHEKRL